MKNNASKILCLSLLLCHLATHAQTPLASSYPMPSGFMSAALNGFYGGPPPEPCGQIEITGSSGLIMCGTTSGTPLGPCTACGVSTTSSLLNGPTTTVNLTTGCFILTFPFPPEHPCRDITVRVVNGPSTGTNGSFCAVSPSDILHFCIQPNTPLYFRVALDANGCCRVSSR